MAYWRAFYHFTTATRHREPLITDAVEAVLERSFASTAQRMGIILHAVGMVEDHVHLVASIPPKLSAAEVMQRFKGASSKAVNDEIPGGAFGWQDSYGMLTFAQRDLESVVSYAMHQKDHHGNGKLHREMERFDGD